MIKDLARSIMPPVLWALLRRIKIRPESREYRIGDFTIALPAGHLLPEYQKTHTKYDQFLPFLASHLDEGIVIDVGANCGDTLAAMASANSGLAYICIEADEAYFRFLEENTRRLKETKNYLCVTLVNLLAGSEVVDVALTGSGGTKKAVVGQGGLQAKRLDEIVDPALYGQVKLVKIDVDGFDYDVINSASRLLDSVGPMIYFETNFSDQKQRDGYSSTVQSMLDSGYQDWTFFDNFGGVVLRTNSARHVFGLLDYLWSQVSGETTLAIAYFDVLAVQQKDSALVDAVLADYAK